MTKEIYERALALLVIETMQLPHVPEEVMPFSPDPPDICARIGGDTRIGIELTRYQEESDPRKNQIRTNNQIHARNLTKKIAERWKKLHPNTEVAICPRYRVGPESVEPFIPNNEKDNLVDQILEICTTRDRKEGPIFMATIPRSYESVHCHLTSLSFSKNILFDTDNFVTARASLEEESVINAIRDKTNKRYNGSWDELWLLIHGGETHSLIPSTSVARTAYHPNASAAAIESKFSKVLIYDMGRVAELDVSTGNYRIYMSA